MSDNFFSVLGENFYWSVGGGDRNLASGWISPEADTCVVDFTHHPPTRKEKTENPMYHKKFYNGLLFSALMGIDHLVFRFW